MLIISSSMCALNLFHGLRCLSYSILMEFIVSNHHPLPQRHPYPHHHHHHHHPHPPPRYKRPCFDEGALDLPPTRWSDASFLGTDDFRFDEALRPTGVVLAQADDAAFSELLRLAVNMRWRWGSKSKSKSERKRERASTR